MNINESNFAKDYIHKNTFMTNKRFHRDEYPFDILGEFGLTENMIYDLPDYVHENIEMGGMSPLLPISIKQPFGCTHCYAKFCLIEGSRPFKFLETRPTVASGRKDHRFRSGGSRLVG